MLWKCLGCATKQYLRPKRRRALHRRGGQEAINKVSTQALPPHSAGFHNFLRLTCLITTIPERGPRSRVCDFWALDSHITCTFETTIHNRLSTVVSLQKRISAVATKLNNAHIGSHTQWYMWVKSEWSLRFTPSCKIERGDHKNECRWPHKRPV